VRDVIVSALVGLTAAAAVATGLTLAVTGRPAQPVEDHPAFRALMSSYRDMEAENRDLRLERESLRLQLDELRRETVRRPGRPTPVGPDPDRIPAPVPAVPER
jgi:hypothetical protein